MSLLSSALTAILDFIRIVIFPALLNDTPGISPRVASHIFENWLCSPDNDFAEMSHSDFYCFKIFFIFINLEKLKMVRSMADR